jgi:hypothetical protein
MTGICISLTKEEGPTGIRTQVARIRTSSDNQLHYGTFYELFIFATPVNISKVNMFADVIGGATSRLCKAISNPITVAL